MRVTASSRALFLGVADFRGRHLGAATPMLSARTGRCAAAISAARVAGTRAASADSVRVQDGQDGCTYDYLVVGRQAGAQQDRSRRAPPPGRPGRGRAPSRRRRCHGRGRQGARGPPRAPRTKQTSAVIAPNPPRATDSGRRASSTSLTTRAVTWNSPVVPGGSRWMTSCSPPGTSPAPWSSCSS